MEGISVAVFMYTLLLFFTLIIGAIFWVKRRYPAASVLAIIFSLAAPLIMLVTIAQRDGEETIYGHVLSRVGSGSLLAIIHLFIHLFLLGWVIFLFILFVRYGIKRNWWIEEIKNSPTTFKNKFAKNHPDSKKQRKNR